MFRKSIKKRGANDGMGCASIICGVPAILLLWWGTKFIIMIGKGVVASSIKDGMDPDTAVFCAWLIGLIAWSSFVLMPIMVMYITVTVQTAALKAGGRIIGNIHNDRGPFE